MKKQHIHKSGSLFSSLLEANIKKRLFAMMWFTLLIILLFISRLFYIQIIKWDFYYKLAQDQQYSKIIIPAKRWEIFVDNTHALHFNPRFIQTTTFFASLVLTVCSPLIQVLVQVWNTRSQHLRLSKQLLPASDCLLQWIHILLNIRHRTKVHTINRYRCYYHH